MASRSYNPLLMETFSEPTNPMSIWDYLKATGKVAKGTLAGAVSAPYQAAKGIDDIIDLFKEQDPNQDVYPVKLLSMLNPLANQISNRQGIEGQGAKLIGENVSGIAKGPVTAAKVAGLTAQSMAPAIVQEEAKNLGLSDQNALLASLATGAMPTGLGVKKPQTKANIAGYGGAKIEETPKLTQAVEATPELEGVLKYLSPEEASYISPKTASKVVSVFNAIDPEEMVASIAEGAPKLGWYQATSNTLSQVFGEDTPRFAALLAAMSPQTSVEMNLINATNTWANWVKAGRPDDPNKIIDIMGASVLGDKGRDSVLDAWKNNSITALTAPESQVVPLADRGINDLSQVIRLSGPKVNEFSQAVQGDLLRFTNDAWQANLTGIPQVMFGSSKTKDNVVGYSPGYLGASAAGRRSTDVASQRLGEPLMPSEGQETQWSFAKALYEQSVETGMPAEQILKEGLLDTRRISEVPDFATLLTQPEYGAPLRDIGYGSLIDLAAENAQGIGQRDLGPLRNTEAAGEVARRLDTLQGHRQFISASKPFRVGFGGTQVSSGVGQDVQGAYRGRSSQSVPLAYGAKGKAIEPNPEYTKATGVQLPTVFQLNKDPQSRAKFVETMDNARTSRGALAQSVDVYSPNEYKNHQLFTTQDGTAGFAISPKGELSSVISQRGTNLGFSDAAVTAAVQNGATWLNAFDTVLPQKYARHGFKPVARLKFDEQFARSEWGDEAVDQFMKATEDFNGGQPDLVFMVYDPNFVDQVPTGVGGDLVGSYDEAIKLVERAKARASKSKK